jgi:hypothetical protein
MLLFIEQIAEIGKLVKQNSMEPHCGRGRGVNVNIYGKNETQNHRANFIGERTHVRS